jgi:hypothetical protein
VFFSVGNGSIGTIDVANRIQQIGVNGSNAATNFVDLSDGSQNGDAINSPNGIAIDAPLQRFFTANGSVHAGNVYYGLFEGLTNATGGNSSLTEIYHVPTVAPGTGDPTNGLDARINGIALDQPNGEIYFTQNVYDPGVYPNGTFVASETGIFKISVNGGGATSLFIGDAISPINLALDTKDNLVFFTAADNITGQTYLDVANLTAGNIQTLDSNFTSDMLAGGVAVDSSGTVYFTTQNGGIAAGNGVFAATFSVSGSGSSADVANFGAVSTLYSGGTVFSLSDIAIDVHDRIFFTTGGTQQTVAGQPLGAVAGIFEGSLSHSGTGSLTQVFSMTNILSDTSIVSNGTTTTPGPAYNTTAPNLFLESTPTVTASGSAGFAQGGTATALASGAAVVNQDGQNLASATVVISGGFIAGDTLTVTTLGSIGSSFSNGTLTLSGNDTLTHYQQELDSVKFSSTASNITQNGSDASRTISWTVSDGIITSATPTTTVNIHAAFVNASGTATFSGGGAGVPLDSGLVVGLTGASNFTSATVTIGNFVSGDSLSVGTPGGLIANYNTLTGVLTLSGTASVATYKTALDSVVYSFTSGGDPTHGNTRSSSSISWLVNDGTVVSPTGGSSLSLVHVAPSITATGTAATFTGGGSAVPLGDTVTITDPDSAGTLTSATVIISSGFVSGDTLTVGTLGGLTTSFTTGTLTLTGTASISTYDTALDSVQYNFTAGGDPTGGAAHSTSRTISWFANDGVSNSNTATTSLNIQHVAPTISVSGTTPTYASSAVPLVSSVTISDVDSGSILTGATVSISSGFFTGDTLNFTNQNGITHTYSGGVLTLSGTTTLSNYQAALQSITYSSTGDPTHGGADTSRTISWVVNDGAASSSAATSSLTTACYLAGTLILTDRGEVPVETLAIGDRVMTLSGAAKPIKWIGHRVYNGRFVTGNHLLLPILIHQDALADGVPRRDLYVSPQHAMFLHDVLVPAELLVNGASIVRHETTSNVEYFHIELDEHDVIYAEGAPAESFVDCDNRNMFHNAHEFDHLYPGGERLTWQFCEARISDGDVLEGIRRELAARLEGLDFTTTFDPDIRLMVDGRPINAERSNGCVYRFILEETPHDVHILSRSSIPAEISVSSADTRRLGVNVSRIILEDEALRIVIGHKDWSLVDGFHEAETAHRWTNGEAHIPGRFLTCFERGLVVEVHMLDFSMPYRITSESPSLSEAPTLEKALI